MATVGEAIAATLIAQWNVGTGGTQPDPIQYLVERPERDPNPTVADAVYVWLPLRRTFDPIDVAEVYRNVTYTLRIVCHTKTSSARQLEIENEVDRILNSGTVITGATRQRVKEINDISNRSYSNLPKYISEVIMEVFTAMEVSATAYGTATTTTLTTDDLIVNTSITGNPTAALGATTITGDASVTGDLTVGTNTDTTDPIEVLKFNTERAWSFRKRGTGAATRFALEADVAAKPFWIGYDDGTIYAAKFTPQAVQEDCTVQLAHDVTVDGDLTISGKDIVQAAELNFKVSGDTDDYWQMYTAGAAQPVLKAVTGGTAAWIFVEGILNVAASGDSDDYFEFITATNIATFRPVEDKVHVLGAAVRSFDHVYSDDFDNTSPFEEFADPITALKKIAPTKEKNKLDYTSLPNFVRTHTRDPERHIWGRGLRPRMVTKTRMITKTRTIIVAGVPIIEEYDEEEEYQVEEMVEVDVIIERAPKDVIEDEGWSVNRMVMFLYQVCQKQQERIEALEAR